MLEIGIGLCRATSSTYTRREHPRKEAGHHHERETIIGVKSAHDHEDEVPLKIPRINEKLVDKRRTASIREQTSSARVQNVVAQSMA